MKINRRLVLEQLVDHQPVRYLLSILVDGMQQFEAQSSGLHFEAFYGVIANQCLELSVSLGCCLKLSENRDFCHVTSIGGRCEECLWIESLLRRSFIKRKPGARRKLRYVSRIDTGVWFAGL
jgi:hypothetical protein